MLKSEIDQMHVSAQETSQTARAGHSHSHHHHYCRLKGKVFAVLLIQLLSVVEAEWTCCEVVAATKR